MGTLFTILCSRMLRTGMFSCLSWALLLTADIRGLRVLALIVVVEFKLRIVHDLAFARADGCTSVNIDIEVSSAPPCELSRVVNDVFFRVLFLRQKRGRNPLIPLCRVDAKYAFRQVHVDPASVPVRGYVTGGHVVVNMRLQFGWRNRPGVWGLVASALEHFYLKIPSFSHKGRLLSRTLYSARHGVPLWCCFRGVVSLCLVSGAIL